LQILSADAAHLDYAELAKTHQFAAVAGNLPYQISSRILVSLSESQEVSHAVVMVQKEVAERAASGPGDSAYGLLSVLLARRFNADMAFEVPPGAFFPPPKVHSAVLRLHAREMQPWPWNLHPAIAQLAKQ